VSAGPGPGDAAPQQGTAAEAQATGAGPATDGVSVVSQTRSAFLAAAATARRVVALFQVGGRWKEPSALAEMSVGALAAHLVRAVTNVDRYIQDEPPDPAEPPVSAAEYFLPVDADRSSRINVGVRATSAEEALVGQRALLGRMDRAMERLGTRLPAEPGGRTVRVRDGEVLLLDDYLRTRLIELTIHSDDLCVSVGVQTPTLPGLDIAVATLIEVATLRHGELAVLRALTRRERDPQDALRVL